MAMMPSASSASAPYDPDSRIETDVMNEPIDPDDRTYCPSSRPAARPLLTISFPPQWTSMT